MIELITNLGNLKVAGSVNKVILIGNLGNDPEIRTMQNGGKLANLSIATSESWKDRNTGERREKTEWHRVVLFNEALVNLAENYLRKGSKIYIEGQLETRKWQDQSGQDKYTTEIVLRPYRGELTMLDSRASGEGSSYGNNNANNGGQSSQYQSGGASPSQSSPAPVDPMEDEIPF